jgi:hypothetical protein
VFEVARRARWNTGTTTHGVRKDATMTTLLDPEIIRASGKPPPNTFEGDAPAPEIGETDQAEDEEEEG